METYSSGAVTPSGPEESTGSGIRLIGGVLRVAVAACLVIWLTPDLLRFVGLDRLARRLSHDAGFRWSLFTALMVLLVVFHRMSTAGRKDPKLARRQQQTMELGGEVVERSGPTAGGAWVDGPGLRLTVAGRPMTVQTTFDGTGKHRSKRTRAVVTIESADLFGFQVLGSRHQVHLLGGLARAAIAHGIREVLRRATTEDERRAAEAAQYLGGPPVRPLPSDAADLLELRSSDPDLAKRVLCAPGVIGALRALDRLESRWEWTLYPTKRAGRAELTLTVPGSADTEVLRAAQTLFQTALGALDEARAA